MKFEISQDNFILLDTFSMVVLSNKSIKLKIAEDMNLLFVFNNDKNEKEHTFTTTIIEKTILKIELINFNNPLGTATKEPILVGDYNGKNIFVHFCVYSLGDNELNQTKIFICSLYQG